MTILLLITVAVNAMRCLIDNLVEHQACFKTYIHGRLRVSWTGCFE
ncbi:MAG: hypothetical protein WDA14_10745 [Sphaerochaetaceae bacterium]